MAVSPDVSRAFESVAQVSTADVDDEDDWSASVVVSIFLISILKRSFHIL
jgi:hypothetical protein